MVKSFYRPEITGPTEREIDQAMGGQAGFLCIPDPDPAASSLCGLSLG
eukprot:CAMPEP_0198571734 /NCGR_PEP_ID=MMETSP1462-20131121/110924_1 /TAXON_ID=1333877 /ORGANISM="Brandtodinium nutriculum, Strain RCC3387" /LENGTH=47 /DNA_ID= /DNA_START= /DNA_END= /DNA_ORIENTATION=